MNQDFVPSDIACAAKELVYRRKSLQKFANNAYK